MMDAELVYEMGTDAAKWTNKLMEVMAARFKWSIEDPTMDPFHEMESLLITWFANAIEKGRDEGPNKEAEQPNPIISRAERAISALRECAEALDDMPFRMTTSVLFGSLPLNNTDNLRKEADNIIAWMDRTAAATAPPSSTKE